MRTLQNVSSAVLAPLWECFALIPLIPSKSNNKYKMASDTRGTPLGSGNSQGRTSSSLPSWSQNKMVSEDEEYLGALRPPVRGRCSTLACDWGCMSPSREASLLRKPPSRGSSLVPAQGSSPPDSQTQLICWKLECRPKIVVGHYNGTSETFTLITEVSQASTRVSALPWREAPSLAQST